ncbi:MULTISPECIES: flagellin N-terminal helical domain-containing protein [Lysinibacillus]|uniref:flagellin N-terminal helical domain-containing protein n=1 Tax=Lysinibacillus TaxID=400634 RepID=UPI0021A4B3A5|nr:flagellin [Lysinibacillus capsici]MCT1541275.1 flagellin [Lysinibacillus capsici]MCT1572453.1 flagellin [Lysinibacillus capsici]MCT1649618.1 flagellin [Lysinibacillus capsici]MCT1728097.1 flagellin [Lysinibacillus capsici]MCT1785838.1 flagellin [Lysinibacillus capsici]
MRIQHNISALNAHRNLGFNNTQASKNLEKLSSGFKINRAGDDAAGLAISEKMRGQIRGLDMATKNSQDAISLIQTAEGALNETHSILQRMRELSVQSGNDTNVNLDRDAIQQEIEQLTKEIDRISNTTEFNTQKLLDGSFSGKFQIGANENQDMAMDIGNMNAASLGLTKTVLAETDVDAKTLKDGSYKVSKDGTELLDSKGQVVGKFDGTAKNKVVLADGSEITFSKAANVEPKNAVINVKGGKADIRVELDTASTKNLSKLAAGKYEISGDNVLKDGVKVGTFTGTEVTIETDGGKGTATFEAADLGLDGNFTNDGTGVEEFTIGGVDVSTREQATGTITAVDDAIKKVSEQRSALGAVQNRLEHTINNLGAASENLTAAESRIRDTDMAKEMMEFTKNNILMQAAQSMLAQANQQPQGVLQLLG